MPRYTVIIHPWQERVSALLRRPLSVAEIDAALAAARTPGEAERIARAALERQQARMEA